MKKPQLYFRDEDSETCHSLDYHLSDAKVIVVKLKETPEDFFVCNICCYGTEILVNKQSIITASNEFINSIK